MIHRTIVNLYYHGSIAYLLSAPCGLDWATIFLSDLVAWRSLNAHICYGKSVVLFPDEEENIVYHLR